MEFQSYNQELAISNILFKRIFNNIRIGRTNEKGEEKQILVNCVFGQRSRIVKNLENPDKRGNMKVPLIVINRTGYSRNTERLNNLNNEVKYEITSTDRRQHLLSPVPVDINYEVSIVAKYPSDIDKIASNFMIFFNSDIFVSCEHPKYEGIRMNNQIVMEDSVSEEHSDEIDGTQDDLVVSTFNFTFKTYLFGGTRKAKLVHSQIVSSYTSSFISNDVQVLTYDQIDDFQKSHPYDSISVMLTNYVTADITSYVDNPDTSADIYDDIPIVNQINFGFYTVPNKYDIQTFITSVDNGEFGEHIHTDQIGYISSESYLSSSPELRPDPYNDGDRISVYTQPLSTVNDYYDKVDSDCSLLPYVDKLYWKIDSSSSYKPPNNVVVIRD